MSRLLFLQHDSVFENYGGIQYYLDDLLTLAAETYGQEEVLSLTLSRKNTDKTQIKAPYKIDWVPSPVSGLRAKLANRFPLHLIWRALKTIPSFKPDLIIASHACLAPAAYFLSRRSHIPFGVIAYGMECWGDLYPQDEWALRRADAIFSISHWTKKILKDRGFESERIRIIHPLLPSFFDEDEQVPTNSKKSFQLLTVARLDPQEKYKGQDDTLHALALLKARSPHLDFRYRIVGEGGDKERLENLARSLKLDSHVDLVPPVKDRAALKALYHSSDLFVMPSRFGKWDGKWRGEGFGIVYVEAAACGVPSIAYNCGGVTDIVEHQETGLLVEQGNRADLALAIEKMMKDNEERKQMGARASTLVRERFSVAAIRKEMEAAFDL